MSAFVASTEFKTAERLLADYQRRVSFVEGCGITEAGFYLMLRILFLENSRRQVTVTRATARLPITATTALRHINALVDAGMVRRGADPEDMRSTILSLTPSARMTLGQYLLGMSSPSDLKISEMESGVARLEADIRLMRAAIGETSGAPI